MLCADESATDLVLESLQGCLRLLLVQKGLFGQAAKSPNLLEQLLIHLHQLQILHLQILQGCAAGFVLAGNK